MTIEFINKMREKSKGNKWCPYTRGYFWFPGKGTSTKWVTPHRKQWCGTFEDLTNQLLGRCFESKQECQKWIDTYSEFWKMIL